MMQPWGEICPGRQQVTRKLRIKTPLDMDPQRSQEQHENEDECGSSLVCTRVCGCTCILIMGARDEFTLNVFRDGLLLRPGAWRLG